MSFNFGGLELEDYKMRSFRPLKDDSNFIRNESIDLSDILKFNRYREYTIVMQAIPVDEMKTLRSIIETTFDTNADLTLTTHPNIENNYHATYGSSKDWKIRKNSWSISPGIDTLFTVTVTLSELEV